METLFQVFRWLSGYWIAQQGTHDTPEGAEEMGLGKTKYHMIQRLLGKGVPWEVHYLPFSVSDDNLIVKYQRDHIVVSLDKLSDFDRALSHLFSGALTWWVKGGDADPRIIVVRATSNQPINHFFRLLGLRVMASAKTSKRLKEIPRATSMFWGDGIDNKPITSVNHTLVDGRSSISVSAAIRGVEQSGMGRAEKRKLIRAIRIGKLKTVKLRFYTKRGMVKNEANIVPDEIFHAKWGLNREMVLHANEFKREIFKDSGPAVGHAWEEASTYGPLFADLQTMTWMRNMVFPYTLMANTISNVLNVTRARLFVEGVIPEYLTATFSDKDVLSSGDANRLREVGKLWSSLAYAGHMNQARRAVGAKSHRVDVRHSGNVLYMAGMSAYSQVMSSDLWAPVPWAGRYHVCTETYIREMCGYDVKHPGMLHFDDRVDCVVYPDEKWLIDADFFGGADLDGDNLAIMFRRVEGTDEVVAVIYRNPNAPGEYKVVHDVAWESFPIYFNEEVDVDGTIATTVMPTVNLDNMPKDMNEVKAAIRFRDLPSASKVATGEPTEWTRTDAVKQLEVELLNPGIGRVANLWMLLAYCEIVPEWAYRMEDVVDACMQRPDADDFAAIDEWINYAEKLLRGASVDPVLLGRHDVRGAWDDTKARISPRKQEKLGISSKEDGYFARLRSYGIGAAQEFNQHLQVNSLQIRQAWPLPVIGHVGAEGVRPAQFSALPQERTAELGNMAKKLIIGSNESFAAVSRAHPRANDRLVEGNREARRALTQAVVRGVSEQLLELSTAERNAVLVMAYRYAITPGGPGQHYGHSDRILYSTLPSGEVSPFMLWVNALLEYDVVAMDGIDHTEFIAELVDALALQNW